MNRSRARGFECPSCRMTERECIEKAARGEGNCCEDCPDEELDE